MASTTSPNLMDRSTEAQTPPDIDESAPKKVRHTALTEHLTKVDPFIHLAGPTSGAGLSFKGSRAVTAQLLTSEGALPAQTDRIKQGLQLYFRVYGGEIAKRICIDVVVAGADLGQRHVKRLEFFLGLGQVVDFKYCPAEVSLLGDRSSWKVTWSTFGGIGTGLDITLDGFDDETRRGLNALSTLQSNMPSGALDGAVPVTFVLDDADNTIEQWLTSIGEKKAPKPWLPYMSPGPAPNCTNFFSLPDR